MSSQQQGGAHDATEQQNMQSVQRLLDQGFNQGNLDVVNDVNASDAVGHDPALPQDIQGPDAMRELISGYRAAFPDLELTIEAQYADGDAVITRWSARGTQDGDLWGMEPTGRQATVSGIEIDVFDDSGMIVESWINWDTLGMLQQVGAITPSDREQAS